MKFIRTSLALTCLAISSAAFAGPSNFQNSCTDIKLSPDNSQILASCKKKDGKAVPASLVITGVENIDGKLTVTGKPSSFLQTCDTVRIKPTPKAVHLTAICKTKAGKPSNTQVELTGISNIDGVLTQ